MVLPSSYAGCDSANGFVHLDYVKHRIPSRDVIMQLWAIQTKLKQEDSTVHLVDAFQKLGLNWAAFPIIPFKDFLPDFDWTDGPVVYYGSTQLIKLASARNHTPLFYNSLTHSPHHYGPQYGDDWLNHDANFDTVKSILKLTEDVQNEKLFFRPNKGTKQFAGGVFPVKDFQNMAKYLIANNAMTEDDIIVCNKVKQIAKEYRTWVVGDDVVAVVGYRQNDKIAPWVPEHFEGEEVKSFARRCAEKYKPSPIFILDVAETEDGYQLVEINSFHSSGFYLTNHILDVVAEVSNFVAKGL